MVGDSRIGQPKPLLKPKPSLEKIPGSIDHAWLQRLKELQPPSPEPYGDSLKAISPAEIQFRGEAEEYASSKLAERIKPGLAGNLKVKVDLKLEDLLIFKNDKDVYVMCRDRSVAEKHLGSNGPIEQVTFTDVNKVLRGGKYQIDIDPSQFSAFQRGSDVRVTPNKKFTDENQGWRLMSKDELDLSKYFAERPSDSGTDKEESKKAIIDLGGPLWEKYKQSIRDSGARVAFEQFLFDVGEEDTKKLLDNFNKLNEAFGKELSEGSGNLTDDYNEEYDKYFNNCLVEFENKLELGSVSKNEMNGIIKSAEEALVNMKGILLEKGFNIFIEGEGADIGSLYEERKGIFDGSSEEAREAIGRKDYHYRDYELIRDEFLTHHFNLKEGDKNYSAETREEYITAMEEILEKSKRLCEWEAKLDKSEIKGDFKFVLEDEQFRKFLNSKEGISTKRLLAEIDYLEQKKPWEGDLTNGDNEDYKRTIGDFRVDLGNFLERYKSELDIMNKKDAINDLSRKLYSAQKMLYKKHFEKVPEEHLNKENITQLEETWDELLKDQSFVSRPEHLESLTRGKNYREQFIRCFYAEREIVRASLEGEDVRGYAKELEGFLEARNELVREGIRKAKYPDNEMWKIMGHYENILRNDELHEELAASLDGVTGIAEIEAKDEIKKILQDIQGMHENIPEELYSEKSFREEYKAKIISFIDSIGQFERAFSDKNNKAEQVHSEAYDVRKFLSDKMFKVFVSKYQGEEYVKIEQMFHRFGGSKDVDALSIDGWKNVNTLESENMRKRFLDDSFELVKTKDEQTIKDCFSRMAESAKRSLEVARSQAEDEVDASTLSTPADINEEERIKNLQGLLKESQDLLDSITVTV